MTMRVFLCLMLTACVTSGTLASKRSFSCAKRNYSLLSLTEDSMRISWSALLFAAAAAACSERTISGPSLTPDASFDRASGPNDDRDVVGGVFTETDDATDNAVVAFARRTDGSLRFLASYPTDGKGLGGANVVDPLQSQYAVLLTPDPHYLYAVNAQSNTIAAFVVGKSGLEKIGTYASGGLTPVSLAATEEVLYVLNKNSNS